MEVGKIRTRSGLQGLSPVGENSAACAEAGTPMRCSGMRNWSPDAEAYGGGPAPATGSTGWPGSQLVQSRGGGRKRGLPLKVVALCYHGDSEFVTSLYEAGFDPVLEVPSTEIWGLLG